MKLTLLLVALLLTPVALAVQPRVGAAAGPMEGLGGSRLCALPDGPAYGHVAMTTPDGYHWFAEVELAIATCSPPIVAQCGALGTLQWGLGFACNSPLPSWMHVGAPERCAFPLPGEPPAAFSLVRFDDETVRAELFARLHLLGEADAQVPEC